MLTGRLLRGVVRWPFSSMQHGPPRRSFARGKTHRRARSAVVPCQLVCMKLCDGASISGA